MTLPHTTVHRGRSARLRHRVAQRWTHRPPNHPPAPPEHSVTPTPRRRTAEEYIRAGMDPTEARIRACWLCDGDGYRLGSDRVPISPPVHCTHQPDNPPRT